MNKAILIVVFIILMVINLIADVVYSVTKNRYIKVAEQQNTLLWATLKESNDISKELIELNLKKDGGKINE